MTSDLIIAELSWVPKQYKLLVPSIGSERHDLSEAAHGLAMLLPHSLAVAWVERLVLLYVDPESMEHPGIRVPGTHKSQSLIEGKKYNVLWGAINWEGLSLIVFKF